MIDFLDLTDLFYDMDKIRERQQRRRVKRRERQAGNEAILTSKSQYRRLAQAWTILVPVVGRRLSGDLDLVGLLFSYVGHGAKNEDAKLFSCDGCRHPVISAFCAPCKCGTIHCNRCKTRLEYNKAKHWWKGTSQPYQLRCVYCRTYACFGKKRNFRYVDTCIGGCAHVVCNDCSTSTSKGVKCHACCEKTKRGEWTPDMGHKRHNRRRS